MEVLNASQSDCCWEFSNPLCHCAYSSVYRDLKVAKFTCFIWCRILSVDTVKCCRTLCWTKRKQTFFLYFVLYSLRWTFDGTEYEDPATLRFYCLQSILGSRIGRFDPLIGRTGWSLVCAMTVSEWVCVCLCTSVSNITVSCTCKNVLGEKSSQNYKTCT